MIPQHLSITNEHYTPNRVVEAARRTVGGFDLDPASCETANRRVKAARYIGLPDDGLADQWSGRVFLNPPGGRIPKQWKVRYGTQSNATAWWRKLTEEYQTGRVTSAVFVGFTLELLRSAQTGKLSQSTPPWLHPFDFTICVPSERLCFGGDQPTHANVIVYLGTDSERFTREFSEIGRCK